MSCVAGRVLYKVLFAGRPRRSKSELFNIPLQLTDPHLKRGQYYVSMLEDIGGISNYTTVDWVPWPLAPDAEGSNVGVDNEYRCELIPVASRSDVDIPIYGKRGLCLAGAFNSTRTWSAIPSRQNTLKFLKVEAQTHLIEVVRHSRNDGKLESELPFTTGLNRMSARSWRYDHMTNASFPPETRSVALTGTRGNTTIPDPFSRESMPYYNREPAPVGESMYTYLSQRSRLPGTAERFPQDMPELNF